MKDNSPIVGWPEWIVTAFLYALVFVQLYLQFVKLPSEAHGMGEGQPARACRCVERTP